MDLYIIRRRSAWADLEEVKSAGEKSTRVGEEMSGQVRWIRSYLVGESDGRIGSVCIYEGRDAESIREHGRRIGAPADELNLVEQTVVVRGDPS
ncbi:DUF4242 domain-containing protein [Ottowia sp.]|uniref:DUF4242 domain-containing protein n=1 Tax=Ottowia sp. TaxID=1898956 RepID=UPI0039E366E2